MKMAKHYASYPIYDFEGLNEKQFKACKFIMSEYRHNAFSKDIKDHIMHYGGKLYKNGTYDFYIMIDDSYTHHMDISGLTELMNIMTIMENELALIVDKVIQAIQENES